MKKKICKTLCLILSLLMLLSLLPMTAMAAEEEVEDLDEITTEETGALYSSDFSNVAEGILNDTCFPSKHKDRLVHTVLGDSIASGFALPGYMDKCDFDKRIFYADGQVIEGSYGKLVSDALNAKTLAHAHSAWRTTDFLNVVKDGTIGEAEIDKTLATAFFKDPANLLTEHYTAPKAIKNSDIITLNIGANDMYTYSLISIVLDLENNGGLDSGSLPEFDLCKINSFDELLDNFCKTLKLVDDAAGFVKDLYAGCEEGLGMFKENLPQVLDYITELNPKAEVFVLSVDNPAKFTVNVTDDLSFDFYTIFSSYAARARIIQQAVCAQYPNVTYVDVTGAPYYGLLSLNTSTLDLNDVELTAVKALQPMHPTPAGHQCIADKLIPVIQSKLNRTAAPTVRLNAQKQPVVTWKNVDGACSYRVYRSTDENTGYRLVLCTEKNGCVDRTAQPGTTYYYRVVAVKHLFSSFVNGASKAAKIKVPAVKHWDHTPAVAPTPVTDAYTIFDHLLSHILLKPSKDITPIHDGKKDPICTKEIFSNNMVSSTVDSVFTGVADTVEKFSESNKLENVFKGISENSILSAGFIAKTAGSLVKGAVDTAFGVVDTVVDTAVGTAGSILSGLLSK